MQYNNKDYKPKLHDRWRALTVKNPYATQLVTAAYERTTELFTEKNVLRYAAKTRRTGAI